MPSSHRRLVHRHVQRILSGTPRELGAGEARLFSFYAPSLQGGLHFIRVWQDIEAPPNSTDQSTQTDKIDALEQAFIVIAPRFSLQADAVDSVFPAPGTSVEHTILPHIVLTDPHLPWNRGPSFVPDDEDKGDTRSRTTWLALMSFSVDELLLADPDIKRILKDLPTEVKREQSETFTLQMRASETPRLKDVINTTAFDSTLDAKDATKTTEVVILRGQLFSQLFVDPEGDQKTINVAPYKYMAHVRKIATDGMANAGSEADEAMFSVVVCPRTGPIDAEVPSLQVVHLLSLVWDKSMPFPKPEDLVAMTSLYSWTYTCLPSKNLASTFELLTNLGQNLNVLRTGDNTQPKPFRDDTNLADLIEARQADGYVISRHRTATGETTAAMLRGPLVPTQVDRPLRQGFSMQSNYGTDLAIFDPDFGLLDSTYSNAWQLGKTLAIADEAFCAALTRLRSAVHGSGLEAAKKEVHALFGADGYGPRSKTADNMVDLVQGLNHIVSSLVQNGSAATSVSANRWRYHDEEEPLLKRIDMLSQNSPHLAPRLSVYADNAALKFAMAEIRDGKGDDTVMYNEYNFPASPDYAYIYSWMLDKIHLANIPAHYLIPDPSFLPQETLRFFFIDGNWADALIDGALSLANHWGDVPTKDTSRTAIKRAINKRLRTKDETLGGWHVQMPRYGFLLRSNLLVQFPDIAVDVKFSESRKLPIDEERADNIKITIPANVPRKQRILVQKRLAPDTMYCLFDAAPPDLRRIIFTMPPHQQCFKIGDTLHSTELTVSWKKLYTTTSRSDNAQPGDTLGNTKFTPDGQPAKVFNWTTRMLSPHVFAKHLVDRECQGREAEFSDKEPSSGVLGLQLNAPILELDIGDVLALDVSPDYSPFQLSTPSELEHTPPLLNPPERYQVSSHSIRRPRPPSPTRYAHLYRQFCQKESPSMPLQSPSPPDDSTLMAGPPQFDLKVYWVRSADRSYIPTIMPLPIDLVFSLKRQPSQSFQPLARMIVVVPYGDMPDNAATDPKAIIPLLAQTTNPPAPRMLSNMRLNVLKRWGPPDDKDMKNCVVFELVPRQQPGVLVQHVEDASFRLPRARITKYEGSKPLTATVKILYDYVENDGVPRRQSFKTYKEVELRAME